MTAPERPWTKRVTVDVWVYVYNGTYFRYTHDIDAAAKELARDLEKLFKEHADWRGTDVRVHKETELQCSFCGREYEEDADGPVCCDRAVQAQKERRTNPAAAQCACGFAWPHSQMGTECHPTPEVVW